jgi:RNA polymerase sigma-70 factor (ECF subfamily)
MFRKKGQITESELLKMLKGSDKEQETAFTEVYSQYSPRIYGYCQRVLDNEDDANDAFQETFMKFYDTAKKGNVTEAIFPFLITIARNLCLNQKRSKRVFVDIVEHEPIFNDSSFEEKELGEIIAKALEKLDFEYREIFVMRQYQELEHSEIAELLNISTTNVKTKYWRAKEKLKDILAPYLNDKVRK